MHFRSATLQEFQRSISYEICSPCSCSPRYPDSHKDACSNPVALLPVGMLVILASIFEIGVLELGFVTCLEKRFEALDHKCVIFFFLELLKKSVLATSCRRIFSIGAPITTLKEEQANQ